KTDRPYVVGQWCHQTGGAWAFRYEAADVMLASAITLQEDWDALARRGIFVYPETWGSDAAGTGGGEDIYQLPEAVNGLPQADSHQLATARHGRGTDGADRLSLGRPVEARGRRPGPAPPAPGTRPGASPLAPQGRGQGIRSR